MSTPPSSTVRTLATPRRERKAGEFSFDVPGCPVPKGRPRATKTKQGGMVVFTPKKTRDAEKAVKLLALAAGLRPIEGPISIECRFVLPDRRRVDVDNLLKLVTDSLNGVAYQDDSQIIELTGRKFVLAGSDGRTEVRVSAATDPADPRVSPIAMEVAP